MTIHFMHDNHTFSSVPSLTDTSREKVKARIMELFEEDRCGCVFARDLSQNEIAHYSPRFDATLMRSVVEEVKIDLFLDKCEEWINWEAR